MANNRVQIANTITITAAAAITSGQGIMLNNLFGVAGNDAQIAEEYELHLTRAWELPKVEAQEWAVGEEIFWDDTEKECTNVGPADLKIGHAIAVAANPSTVGTVRLSGAAG